MKNMLLGIMVIVAGVSAIELNVGIISHAGLAHSVLSTSQQGTYNSNEPVFQLGLGLTIWPVRNFGIQTSLHYGWSNYDYKGITSEWDCRNLIMPFDFLYGIHIGNNRIVCGGGFSICRGLVATGKVGFITPIEVPDSLLETTVGPELLLGMEFHAGRMRVFPSFKYAYGLDGVSTGFPTGWPTVHGDISNHYLLMGLGILYRL